MHQIYHLQCPQYLVNQVSFTSDAARQRLRSTATRAAVSVRTRTNLGRRAFSGCVEQLTIITRLIDSQAISSTAKNLLCYCCIFVVLISPNFMYHVNFTLPSFILSHMHCNVSPLERLHNLNSHKNL